MRRGACLALAGFLLAASCAPKWEGPGESAGREPVSRAPRRVRLGGGDALPESVAALALPAAAGEPVTLAGARREKGLLVVFTCNTCPYAKAWETRLVALGNEQAERGIGVVFVNSNAPSLSNGDDLASMAARVAERGHRFPYVADATGQVARAFGAARTPEAFLFDGNARLAYHGAVDDNAQAPDLVTASWLRDALAAVAAGVPVPVSGTKALGCGIKLAE